MFRGFYFKDLEEHFVKYVLWTLRPPSLGGFSISKSESLMPKTILSEDNLKNKFMDMEHTVSYLIHNGASSKGIKIIQKLLSENDYTHNIIKNKVYCIDCKENIHKLQAFLDFDEFVFYPLDAEILIDINEHIDQVIIVSEKGNSYAKNIHNYPYL